MSEALVPAPARAVTLRSVLLGLVGVVLICGLTPYNDYALNNTFLVGNNLPLGVVMLMFIIAVAVNGPLCRFAPRWALSGGELTVAMAMMLVSCALPSSGLMRYLPPALVAPFWHARSDAEYLHLLEGLNLPRWLYPAFEGDSARQWMGDPLVEGYMGRLADPHQPVPYGAWATAAASWGIFTFALYGALLCIVCIVRRQWAENERLAFPLAQIQLALVEQPRPGHWLGEAFRQRAFWIAFAGVFLLHSLNAVARYTQAVPEIPVYYNLWPLFGDPPLSYVDTKIKDAAVFFTVVGVSYFLTSSIALSLWLFYILEQLRRMYLGTYAGDPTIYGRTEEHFGALVAFFLTLAWVGRRHWLLVARQALRGWREGEARGRYLPYAAAFWGLAACAAVMVGWLVLAGSSVAGAVVTVGIMLMGFVLITRIIAETGLVHGQIIAPYFMPWTLSATYGLGQLVPLKTFFLTSMVYSIHYDYREVVPVYASHGMRVSDETLFGGHAMRADDGRDRRTGRRIVAALALALLVGYVVSFASTLWMEYRFAWTQDVLGQTVNEWGAVSNPRSQMLNSTLRYQRMGYAGAYDPLSHMAGGFSFAALLAALRLRFSWWPLHPVGYLMLGTFPMAHLWFSIFWGWLCKLLILKFGGASMYQRAKPFFLGLIVGESMAAGAWLALGFVLSTLGLPYQRVNIMPG